MAIVQISRIQIRRGLQTDLPQLASGEMGWSIDARRLYIGNGTLDEGAPELGVTEILTELTDILAVEKAYTFKGLASGSQIVTGINALNPIVRTLQDKVDEVVSIKDFGAIGDGINDDTAAIQRALNRVYGTAQSTLLNFYHRTILFPVGTYRITATLDIPPFTRIQGEGKKTTIIQGAHTGPLAQLVDGFGQSGVNFGATDGLGGVPTQSDYYFNDISFTHQSATFNQSCFLIDGGTSVGFNKVQFSGLLANTSGDYAGTVSATLPIYNIDRGAGVAAVQLRNLSSNAINRNITFEYCDFYQHNYGVELNYRNQGIAFNNCYFDRLYNYVVMNNSNTTPSTRSPEGVTFNNNYFKYSAASGIVCNAYATLISSTNNLFTNWGVQDNESTTAVVNTTGLSAYPAIVLNSERNSSLSDLFRNGVINSSVKLIEDNGYSNYYIHQELGTVGGRVTTTKALTIILSESVPYISAGLSNIPSNYTNLTLRYTMNHGNNQRTGFMRISRLGGVFFWDEDYVETGTTGLVLRVNTSTGNIEYKLDPLVGDAILTYNFEYYTA